MLKFTTEDGASVQAKPVAMAQSGSENFWLCKVGSRWFSLRQKPAKFDGVQKDASWEPEPPSYQVEPLFDKADAIAWLKRNPSCVVFDGKAVEALGYRSQAEWSAEITARRRMARMMAVPDV